MRRLQNLVKFCSNIKKSEKTSQADCSLIAKVQRCVKFIKNEFSKYKCFQL